MRTRRSQTSLALLVIMILLGATGCGILPGPGDEPEIGFWASEEMVPPGGCAMLHWEVRGAEDFPVFLDGREVRPEGEEEVCLGEPTTFELVVGAPGGSIRETVTINVEGEPPPEEPPPGEPPPEEPPPQEPPPEEPGAEGEPEVVMLVADPDAIPQGACAMLHWEVHPPEWPVLLNGQEVPPIGEREECPQATTTYELLVEAPGGPHMSMVTLHVEAGPEPEPTPQPPGPTPTSPPPGPTATSPPPPPGPTATSPPPGPTATPTPFTTDLAITDLYADKLLNGTVYGRFTNRGPGNLANVVVNVSCQWSKTAYGATFGVIEQMGPRNMTIISLSPNQTTPFSTNITVDLTQFWYDMTCTVQVPFNDPNTTNNSYNETLARP